MVFNIMNRRTLLLVAGAVPLAAQTAALELLMVTCASTIMVIHLEFE